MLITVGSWLLSIMGMITLPLWISEPNVRWNFDTLECRDPKVGFEPARAAFVRRIPSNQFMAIRREQDGGGVVPIAKPP